jgi:hypothetical protein
MPDINIGSKFDAKGFKQAETATDKLGKGVKSLAKSFGLAFGTAQVLAFAKDSVKAAAADEKAQKQLSLALKNVGLSRDAAASEDFIQKLQSEFGILDDKLRPAYQTLAVATRDTAESQKLLQLALDISASTGKDLGSVTSALSKAYLGNNTALSKLGVGISKADLKAKSFKDITDELSTTFAGAATQSANTFQGSMDKLGVASANVKEIIGTGLIDALKAFGEDDSVSNFAKDMENTALYLADVVRGVGQLISYVKQAGDAAENIPVLNKVLEAVLSTPFFMPVKFLNQLGSEARHINEAQQTSAQALNHLAELQSKYVVKTLGNKKKLTAEEAKALNAAKLKLALEKANLALNKGQDVFDMDKIQIAAALTSQAEQLGKATSTAQSLQIANDIARLNVKKSIADLEDAIAAKDEAAIVAATNKLNADLKILGTLTGQKVTLTSIESILSALKPKELIDQENLNQALTKIKEMMTLLGMANTASKSKVPTSGSLGSGIPAGDFIAPISTKGGSIGAILEYADAAAARANAFADLLDLQNAADAAAFNASPLGNSMGNNIAITINTGVGDPNAIAEAIDQVLIDAVQRGTLRGGSY